MARKTAPKKATSLKEQPKKATSLGGRMEPPAAGKPATDTRPRGSQKPVPPAAPPAASPAPAQATAPPARTAKSAHTRAHILDTALTLFQTQGYEQTTMRDIAVAADMATGAAYYYFGSKDELILAFYERMTADMSHHVTTRLAPIKDLRRRLEAVPLLWLEMFAPHRSLMKALLKAGIDIENPVSPFAPGAHPLRQQAIHWYDLALDGSSATLPKDLRPLLPRLLWLFQMSIVLFWIYDTSPDQRRTRTLLSGTLDLICLGLKLSALPLLGPFRRKVIALCDTANLQAL